jgi:hypothetical protein
MAQIKDEEAIDTTDCLVFRDNQPAEVALDLPKNFGRQHRREKGSVGLDHVENFNSQKHMSTSRDLNGQVCGGIPPLWGCQRRNAIKPLQKSSGKIVVCGKGVQ